MRAATQTPTTKRAIALQLQLPLHHHSTFHVCIYIIIIRRGLVSQDVQIFLLINKPFQRLAQKDLTQIRVELETATPLEKRPYTNPR